MLDLLFGSIHWLLFAGMLIVASWFQDYRHRQNTRRILQMFLTEGQPARWFNVVYRDRDAAARLTGSSSHGFLALRGTRLRYWIVSDNRCQPGLDINLAECEIESRKGQPWYVGSPHMVTIKTRNDSHSFCAVLFLEKPFSLPSWFPTKQLYRACLKAQRVGIATGRQQGDSA